MKPKKGEKLPDKTQSLVAEMERILKRILVDYNIQH
jgi:hypothetical protein